MPIINMYPLYSMRGIIYTGIGGTFEDSTLSPDDAEVTLSVGSGGVWSAFSLHFGSESHNWRTGGGASISYWIRWNPVTGSPNSVGSDSTGVWLSLASTRSWGVTFTALNGSRTATGTVEIATDSSGTNIVSSGTVTLRATVET